MGLSGSQMGQPMAPPTGYSVPIGQGTGLGPGVIAHTGMTVAGNDGDNDDESTHHDGGQSMPPPQAPPGGGNSVDKNKTGGGTGESGIHIPIGRPWSTTGEQQQPTPL